MRRLGLALALSLTLCAAAPAPAPDAAGLGKLGQGIGDTTLIDDTGKELKWASLGGRPHAVFFGFTNCPVICPVTVWELEAALKKIGADKDDIQVVFVSLDPARDKPEVLKSYFSSFNGLVRGLTGTDANVARVAKAFEVTYEQVALTGRDYTLDHTAAVFLLNKDGAVVDTIAYGTPQDVIVARLKGLLGKR
jgi:protein SCO1/2